MSKATTMSATEPTLDDSRTDPDATSAAVEAPYQDIYGTPYALDYDVARQIAKYHEERFDNCSIDGVEIRRMASRLSIRLKGTPVISMTTVRSALPDNYSLDGMMAHSNGAVNVDVSYVG